MDPIETVKRTLLRKSSDFDYQVGKIPPQAKDLEEMVLGALLIDSHCMMEVGKILKTEMFYVDQHQCIFSACCQLFIDNSPIDLETVVNMLKKQGNLDAAGGPYYVAQLTNRIGSSAHVEYHSLIVKEEWIKRSCISISTETIKDAYEDTTDAHDVLGNALSHLTNLQNDISRETGKTWNEVLADKVTSMEERAQMKDDDKHVIGKATGLYSLDRKSLGYKNTNLIILAGRPAEGKSTLMVQGAHHNLTRGIPVGIFSLEMSKEELLDKFISIETGIDSEKIQTARLNPAEWAKFYPTIDKMKSWPIQIDDTGGLNINELVATAKLWKYKHGIEMLYVDYIQLVEVQKAKGSFQNREQDLSQISRSLKKLAKELEIPVIALCAIGRKMDERPVAFRRPILTDLRESGAIEQDANMVVFVFRPEEHGIQLFTDNSPTKGITEVIIAKNRMGKKGVIRAKFLGASNKFDDSDFNNLGEDEKETSKQTNLPLGEGNWTKVSELEEDPF